MSASISTEKFTEFKTFSGKLILYNKVFFVHLPSGTWTFPVNYFVAGTDTDNYVLNRNLGGYFYGLDYVIGDITGTWQGRLREAVCAMIGTWSTTPLTRVWVGTEAIIPGKNVDVVSLDINYQVALIEAKGPGNVSASIPQFENSAIQLYNKYGWRLQEYGQILVIDNTISEPSWGVIPDGHGYCILTYNNQPVICNGQFIWVVFTKRSNDNTKLTISSQGYIPDWTTLVETSLVETR